MNLHEHTREGRVSICLHMLVYCPRVHLALPAVSLCLAPDYRCRDGRCVPGRLVCDGEFDCTDGGDEDSCQCRC